jgi:rhodanese-related sulfurtransferase
MEILPMKSQEIDIETTKTLLDNTLIIDVRETDAWDAGHLPNALHLRKEIIEQNIRHHTSDNATPIIIYCGGGSRSLLVTENLQKMGYRHVKSMKGGFRGWKAAEYPVAMD